MTTEQILTLLATMAGLVATILGGVWFIVAKAMGIGAFSRRVDEIDQRTASASCEARTKEISAAKGEIRDIQNKCGVLISKVETHDKAIEESKAEQKETKTDFQALLDKYGVVLNKVETHDKAIEESKAERKETKTDFQALLDKYGVVLNKVETHDKAIEEAKKEQKETRADVIDTRATVRSHEREMEEIRKNIWIQSENISKITAALSLKEWGPVFSAKHSPRRLTDFGNRILDEVGGMEFLREHKDIFFRQIDGRNPKTAFDVERAANTACLMTTAEDIFIGMKNFVYNAPAYPLTDAQGRLRDYELTLDDVCYVLSIPLRDMYLQEHPEIMEQ
jgi:peptidoglycan hydrolase CwlO-like protein